MSLRSKAVAAVCAAGFALSGGVAMAHDPNEFGSPLTHPFGQNFWMRFEPCSTPIWMERRPASTSAPYFSSVIVPGLPRR